VAGPAPQRPGLSRLVLRHGLWWPLVPLPFALFLLLESLPALLAQVRRRDLSGIGFGRFEGRRPEQRLYSHRVTYSFAPAAAAAGGRGAGAAGAVGGAGPAIRGPGAVVPAGDTGRTTRGGRRSARVVAHPAAEGPDHRPMLRLSWLDATRAPGDSLPVPEGRGLPASGEAITVLIAPRTGRVRWQRYI